MTSGQPQPVRVVVSPAVQAYVDELAASTDSSERAVLQQLLIAIRRFETGRDRGHHALTDESAHGRGDLRDCTASEFNADGTAGQHRARGGGEIAGTHRLVWRLTPGEAAPQVEVVAAGVRHHSPNVYTRTLMSMDRFQGARLAENDAFGELPYRGQASIEHRTPVLEAQRRVALSRVGARPMSSSVPMSVSAPSASKAHRTTPTNRATRQGPGRSVD